MPKSSIPTPVRVGSIVDWSYEGKPNPAFGTGASRGERLLGLSAAVGFVALFVSIELYGGRRWSFWVWLVYALLVFDVAGGVTANALNSCKRFYFSPLRPSEVGFVRLVKSPTFFTAIHLHTILVELTVPGGRWQIGLAWYLLLLLSVIATHTTPLHLRRPVAFTLIVIALQLSQTVMPMASGFGWFVPALFLKIVYGHSVQEEPYRPPAESAAA